MHRHCITSIAALTHWLTPQVWKEAHRAQGSKDSQRWKLHPLLMVLTLMTWTTGDSEAERFATARAFYVARHQREKRPGKSFQGFQKALAKLPLLVLHALFAALRRRLLCLYERYWSSLGFVVLACDGSRQECPRSAELEKRLGCCSKSDSAPMLYITSLVLLPAGVLWSWCVGPGTASEHDQLRQLLLTLPRCALLVADACYLGYDLFTDILNAKAEFLVRVSSRAYLYTEKRQPLSCYRDGPVYYWPGNAQQQGRPPLLLRLIRVAGKKGHDVWLLTSVVESTRLSHRQAADIYRWRWQIEISQPYYLQRGACISARARTTVWLPSREDHVFLRVLFTSRRGCQFAGDGVIALRFLMRTQFSQALQLSWRCPEGPVAARDRQLSRTHPTCLTPAVERRCRHRQFACQVG